MKPLIDHLDLQRGLDEALFYLVGNEALVTLRYREETVLILSSLEGATAKDYIALKDALPTLDIPCLAPLNGRLWRGNLGINIYIQLDEHFCAVLHTTEVLKYWLRTRKRPQ